RAGEVPTRRDGLRQRVAAARVDARIRLRLAVLEAEAGWGEPAARREREARARRIRARVGDLLGDDRAAVVDVHLLRGDEVLHRRRARVAGRAAHGVDAAERGAAAQDVRVGEVDRRLAEAELPDRPGRARVDRVGRA